LAISVCGFLARAFATVTFFFVVGAAFFNDFEFAACFMACLAIDAPGEIECAKQECYSVKRRDGMRKKTPA
jgi:hypothetical protein